MVIERGGLTPNTARFTASRDPAALADRGKGGLKYLYTLTVAQKRSYFKFFLANKPSGKINYRKIEVAHDTAVDAGIYTFTFAKTGAVVKARYTFTYRFNKNKWLITSHHSSRMPEDK